MSISQKTRYSSTDICKIIKACADNNVEQIDIEGLKVNFLTKPKDDTTIKEYNFESPQHPVGDQSNNIQSEPNQKALQQLQEAEEMDFFQMNDPEAYEQSLILERHSEDA